MKELIDFRNMPNTAETEEAIAEEMYSLVAYSTRFYDPKNVDKLQPDIDAVTEIHDWLNQETYDWFHHGNMGLSTSIPLLSLDMVRDRLGYGQFEIEWKRIAGDNLQNPTKEQVERYYKKGFGTIFETMNNHTSRTQLCLMRYIIELLERLNPGVVSPYRVLDLGGGCGTLDIVLSKMGFDVWYKDVEGSLTEKFACWRFDRRDLPVGLFVEQDRYGTFGGKWHGDVVCLEVIEHLWNPMAFLVWLSNLMLEGDHLISSESCQDVCVPIHLNGNWPFKGNAYIAIMENFGFEYLGGEELLPEKAMGLEWYMYQNVLRVFRKVGDIPKEVVEWYRRTDDEA